jgi:hypothetical protein
LCRHQIAHWKAAPSRVCQIVSGVPVVPLVRPFVRLLRAKSVDTIS